MTHDAMSGLFIGSTFWYALLLSRDAEWAWLLLVGASGVCVAVFVALLCAGNHAAWALQHAALLLFSAAQVGFFWDTTEAPPPATAELGFCWDYDVTQTRPQAALMTAEGRARAGDMTPA